MADFENLCAQCVANHFAVAGGLCTPCSSGDGWLMTSAEGSGRLEFRVSGLGLVSGDGFIMTSGPVNVSVEGGKCGEERLVNQITTN